MTKEVKQNKQKDRKRVVHEGHQSDNELWEGSDDEINRAIAIANIKYFNCDSMHSVIVKKTKNKQYPKTQY